MADVLSRSPRSTNELEQIRFALDQSAIVATTDVPGRIKYVNDKFCEISKYSREELIGQDHRILNSGFHPKEFMRGLWRTIAQGQIFRGEIRNRAKDGSLYWVDTTIVPFLDDHGKPWQYMAIRYDITERKRHEQHLRDQAALTSLGELAAVVAHEVRNPLAGIRGGLQILEASCRDHQESAEMIREIIGRIDSLNAVVSDLLAFARLAKPRRGDLDLTAFMRDLVSSLRLDPDMAKVVLEARCPPGLRIEGDADQLRLVFSNLLLNAAQGFDGPGRIDIDVAGDDERLVVTVADDGPGIPAELLERVFEPFFTTRTRGTGLGLPTARRVVEAHGGELTLARGVTGGTVARIVLPRHQVA